MHGLYQEDNGEEAIEHVAMVRQVAPQAQRKHLEQQLQHVVQDEDVVKNLKRQKNPAPALPAASLELVLGHQGLWSQYSPHFRCCPSGTPSPVLRASLAFLLLVSSYF